MNRDESVRTNMGALQILYTLSSRVNIQYFEKNKISNYQIICQNELMLLVFFSFFFTELFLDIGNPLQLKIQLLVVLMVIFHFKIFLMPYETCLK